MDGDRFDSFVRQMATRQTRRGLLRGALVGLVAGGLTAPAARAQVACPPGQTQNKKGQCGCPAGTDACPTGCFDLRNDPANCGICGQGCSGGECRKGTCRCPAGTLLCGQSCIATGNDVANCGGCGVVCPTGAPGTCEGSPVCSAGVCGFAPAPSGTVCRPAVGGCDLADACDGVNLGCPADAKAAPGTACDDGNPCTQNDACDGAGGCIPGPAVVCAASDQCHDPGVCDPATGLCSNLAKPDGTACGGEIGGQVCCAGACCGVGEECIAGSCRGDCVAVGGTCADEAECCQNLGFAGCEDGICCFALEEGCAADGECCSGRCNGEFCCVRPGGGCGNDGQCCGGGLGACHQGVCACTEIGSACAGTSECCDGLACSGGTCQPTGCLNLTERCEAAGQCCDSRALCAEGRVETGAICCLAPGQSCGTDVQCCGFASVCAAGTCCQSEGGACDSSLGNTGCCAGLTCTGVNGTCELVCPIDSRVCGVGCCPIGQECCNGSCCGANQDCRNNVCQDCLGVRADCDPANNLCCQDVATFCLENGLVGRVGQECCRAVGAPCTQANDFSGKGDCCVNSYAFVGSGFSGNCGFGGICGAEGGVCGANGDCVGGSCRGRCDNQFPVKRCQFHEECDCEGDIDDGCVENVGFCVDKRCQA